MIFQLATNHIIRFYFLYQQFHNFIIVKSMLVAEACCMVLYSNETFTRIYWILIIGTLRTVSQR